MIWTDIELRKTIAMVSRPEFASDSRELDPDLHKIRAPFDSARWCFPTPVVGVYLTKALILRYAFVHWMYTLIHCWYAQDTVGVVPPYPYCIEEDRLEAALEDSWYARLQLFFKCYLRLKHGREPKNSNYTVGPRIYMYIHVYMCIYWYVR